MKKSLSMISQKAIGLQKTEDDDDEQHIAIHM